MCFLIKQLFISSKYDVYWKISFLINDSMTYLLDQPGLTSQIYNSAHETVITL
jgi:hypothetical protein